MTEPVCPHCAGGHKPVFREATKEWVHRRSVKAGNGVQFSITLCLAPPKDEADVQTK